MSGAEYISLAPARNRLRYEKDPSLLSKEVEASGKLLFLELTAIESCQPINLSKIAADVGVSRNTIAAYFQILEDCLIVERIEPLTRSITRSRLTKSPKYLFFDLGVRRAAANEDLSPTLILERPGRSRG